MRRLLGSVCILLAFGGYQASSKTQAERPPAEQSPAVSQPLAPIGECSRCYVEILDPEKPAARVRICRQASSRCDRPGSSFKRRPNEDAQAPCCSTSSGVCCACPPTLGPDPESTESKDARISVGPDAEVRFERGPLQVSRRGPTEFALSEVGLDQALPLQIVCHPPLSGR